MARVADLYSGRLRGDTAPQQEMAPLRGVLHDPAYGPGTYAWVNDCAYWHGLFIDRPEHATLSIRLDNRSWASRRETCQLPAAMVDALKDLAKRVGSSLPAVLAAAVAAYVGRLTGRSEILLGWPVTARFGPAARLTPAMLSNVVPLRFKTGASRTIGDLIRQATSETRRALRHQRYPQEVLRRDLGIDPTASDLFGTIVNIMPFARDAMFGETISQTHNLSNGPVRDLMIVFYEADAAGLRLDLDGNIDRYSAEELNAHATRLFRILSDCANPDSTIGEIDILSAYERQQLLIDWNQSASDYPRDLTIDELFSEQARLAAERPAAVFRGDQLSYRELDDQSDEVAKRLRSLGVGPDVLVGLYVDRSLYTLVGLLGILKAGGAYVPLDPIYPRDRLAAILEDARPPVLVTQLKRKGELPPHPAAVICLDAMHEDAVASDQRPTTKRSTSDRAYVIYTSGSTGKPKGVQIPHRAVVNFLCSMQREPGLTARDTLLAVTTISFDIAGLELLLPLVCGAKVVIAGSEVVADGVKLAALLKECEASVMQGTPSTWRLLLSAGWNGNPNLKILCGGEAWASDLAEPLVARCASLWNMYGPTETTIWSAVSRVKHGQPVTIGFPIANTSFHVLDTCGQLSPLGIAGELHIGGEGVAHGYLNRPELTEERFIVDPFGAYPSGRLYKTGDLVRRLPDGHIEFIGRLDHQVKIRGFRIELGEIEGILKQHPDVQEAVVVMRDDTPDNKFLVAYLTATGSSPTLVSELRNVVKQKLPTYMIPTAFVVLDAFPVTPNGKLDRKALPLPGDEDRRGALDRYVAPRTPSEELLTRLWRELLHLKRVGIHDNFFDSGGDSLSMLRLSLEIERATGQSFPLTSIYEAPTVAGMAEFLDGQRVVSSYSPLLLLRAGAGALPVFLIHPAGGSTIHLMPMAKLLPNHHPVYGVQAKGLDGTEAPNDRVEAMAECYISAITEVQPRGPYFLVGNCFGGLVALEIARRLSERGDKIGLLAFLDTYLHPHSWPLHFRINYFVTRRIKELWSELSSADRRQIIPIIIAKAKTLASRASERRSVIEAPAAHSPSPAVRAVFEGGATAFANYQPRYYAGKVSYLICGYHGYLLEAPTSVWGRLVGQLEVQYVPRDHAQSPSTHSAYVADWLSHRIKDATSEHVRPSTE